MPPRKAVPPRAKVPKGSMSDINRPAEGRKPGPTPKVYKTTPRATPTPTPTPSASSVSQTPAFLRRLHPSLYLSVDHDDSPPSTPRSTSKGSTPAHLSRTHLFPSPLPPSLQQSNITNTSGRTDRFLHNVPFEEEIEDPIPTESWLDHNPNAPPRTPGLTSPKGWLQNIKIKQEDQYKAQSWRLEQLPMVFDSLVSHSEQLNQAPRLCTATRLQCQIPHLLSTCSRRLALPVWALPSRYSFATFSPTPRKSCRCDLGG